MAVLTRLELAPFSLTGRESTLKYNTEFPEKSGEGLCRKAGIEPAPFLYKRNAQPVSYFRSNS